MLYRHSVNHFRSLHPNEIIHFFSAKDHQQLRQSCRLSSALLAEIALAEEKELPLLKDVFPLFELLQELILVHLSKEEKMVFPYALHLLSKSNEITFRPDKLLVGLLKSPMEAINREHVRILALLSQLRGYMKNYCFSEDYSEKMRLLCTELFILEQSMMWHFYIQENVLYPKLLLEEKELVIHP